MTTTPTFQTDEILWYDNGVWGQAGYAVPNPAGKTWTNNSVIFTIHDLIGRNLFEMMHRPDVKFYRPPMKQFWYDLHQLLTTCRKRLSDRQKTPNDSNGLSPIHAQPAPQVFVVYPIPFFGQRIRQPDVREYAQLSLLLLSEMMQHSDNDYSTFITEQFASMAGKYLQEILALMATKFFGYSRAAAYDPAFSLKDADFTNYNPGALLTSVEMTEERPPLQWWPTENDLAAIRGIPVNEALLLAQRWPTSALLDSGDPSVFPGPTGTTATPTTTTGTTTTTGATTTAAAPVSFTAPAGQAP